MKKVQVKGASEAIGKSAATVSGAAQVDHCFHMESLRKKIDEGYSLDAVTFLSQCFQIACKRCGITGYIDHLWCMDSIQNLRYLRP